MYKGNFSQNKILTDGTYIYLNMHPQLFFKNKKKKRMKYELYLVLKFTLLNLVVPLVLGSICFEQDKFIKSQFCLLG